MMKKRTLYQQKLKLILGFKILLRQNLRRSLK